MYDIKVNYISISVTFRHIFPTEHLKFIQIKGEQFELSGISMRIFRTNERSDGRGGEYYH